jgi:hypothetical protein
VGMYGKPIPQARAGGRRPIHRTPRPFTGIAAANQESGV